MKENLQEYGFVIGGIVGFALLVYENARTTRGTGSANYILVLLCAGVGWGIGWLIGLLR